LAAIAIPRFMSQTQNAKVTADQATARNIAGALNIAVADGNAMIKNNTIAFEGRAGDDDADPVIPAITAGDATGKEAVTKLTEWGYLDTIDVAQSTGNPFTIVITNGVLSITDGNGAQFYPVP